MLRRDLFGKSAWIFTSQLELPSIKKRQKDNTMTENISTLENSASVLSVTLRENNLTKNGTYYATVSRNTATLKNILSEIAEDNKGVDPYMLQLAAILIQKKILKMLEQGKAVNVLDLGTLYIAMKCNAKGRSDVSGSGNFHVKFTPTGLVNSALKKLAVDKVVYADGSPEITEVTALCDDNSGGGLSAGKPCRIKGSRLKIGGDDSGIWFAPVSGSQQNGEGELVRMDDSALFRNKPTELNFFIPQSLEPGDYQIVLRTSYLGNNKSRKSAVQTISDVVQIKSSS